MLFKNQNTFPKHKCVLPKHIVFSICWTCSPYRRETIPRIHTEKLSRNRWLQENMESCQNHFLVRIQHCPPLFFHPVSSWSTLLDPCQFISIMLSELVSTTTLEVRTQSAWRFYRHTTTHHLTWPLMKGWLIDIDQSRTPPPPLLLSFNRRCPQPTAVCFVLSLQM